MNRTLLAAGGAALMVIAIPGAARADTTTAAGPAAADQPAWGGPQYVDSSPLVGDPLSLQCGDRHLEFTGGDLLVRGRMLPTGAVQEIRRPVNATLEDQLGTDYQLHGIARLSGTESGGTFRVTGAVTGPAGMTGTVNTLFTFEGNSITAEQRGTCEVVVAG
jgi:hypothetical protein